MADDHLEQRLRCFGYYGFGSGYALARWGPKDDTAGLYCNRCRQAATCWPRHRARVRALMPAAAVLVDEIARTHKGPEVVLEFMRRSGQTDTNHIREPYTAVMMGNMQDGAQVASGARPAERGDGTLTWPLTPLE